MLQWLGCVGKFGEKIVWKNSFSSNFKPLPWSLLRNVITCLSLASLPFVTITPHIWLQSRSRPEVSFLIVGLKGE